MFWIMNRLEIRYHTYIRNFAMCCGFTVYWNEHHIYSFANSRFVKL